ncbi:MAG: hypothetical protein GXY86_17925 [Firmicutes bacterium]|nr:hypothetical protein [Bacillota bacterium]
MSNIKVARGGPGAAVVASVAPSSGYPMTQGLLNPAHDSVLPQSVWTGVVVETAQTGPFAATTKPRMGSSI